MENGTDPVLDRGVLFKGESNSNVDQKMLFEGVLIFLRYIFRRLLKTSCLKISQFVDLCRS